MAARGHPRPARRRPPRAAAGRRHRPHGDRCGGGVTLISRRHDLLRLRAGAWAALLHRRPDLAGCPALGRWAIHRHPVMRRRAQPGDAPGWLPAAIALPPAEGSRRLAFELPADAVEAVRPPPLLADALRGGLPGQLPNDWTGIAGRLVAIGEQLAFAPRLFGSLMWQCVTGLPYVRDGSDLDLLWTVPPGGEARVPALLDALDAVARGGHRLDGEISFCGVGAASWRELLAAGPEHAVLVKTETAVALMTRAQLLAPARR